LAIALATASAAAVAQQTDQTADAEHMRHVSAIAKGACPQVGSADRAYRWNTDDTPCVTKAMDGGLERPQGTIAVVHTHGTIRNPSDS